MKRLTEIYRLDEMALEVPDDQLPGLKRAIRAAVNSEILPPEANSWVKDAPEAPKRSAKGTPPPEPGSERPKGKAKKAKDAPAPKPAGPPAGPRNGDEEDFPDLGAPQGAATDVGDYQVDGGYRSPFGHMPGHSSWDDVPDWMRDPDKMPAANGGSRYIPGKDGSEPPSSEEDPMARWQGKVSNEPDQQKKPGLLSRLFGRKGKA